MLQLNKKRSLFTLSCRGEAWPTAGGLFLLLFITQAAGHAPFPPGFWLIVQLLILIILLLVNLYGKNPSIILGKDDPLYFITGIYLYFFFSNPHHIWDPFFFSITALGPIREEILFRGFLFHNLAAILHKKMDGEKAIFLAMGISSFIFAFVHFRPGLLDNLELFLAGIIFSLVYWKAGLYAAMAVHIFHNTLSFH